MDTNIKEELINQYKNIISKHWDCLNNTYKIHVKNQYHRSKICSFKNIQKTKENVYNKNRVLLLYLYFLLISVVE